MEERRAAAPPEGSEGRRGFRGRVLWRGLAEKVDLKRGLAGERGAARERREREEIWVGILTVAGWAKILGGLRKWEGRIVDKDREMDAMGR